MRLSFTPNSHHYWLMLGHDPVFLHCQRFQLEMLNFEYRLLLIFCNKPVHLQFRSFLDPSYLCQLVVKPFWPFNVGCSTKINKRRSSWIWMGTSPLVFIIMCIFHGIQDSRPFNAGCSTKINKRRLKYFRWNQMKRKLSLHLVTKAVRDRSLKW